MDRENLLAPTAPDLRVPADMSVLLATLEQTQIHHVLADYWIAYRISFESQERVIATSTTHVRYAPHDAEVRADPSAAYVFIAGAADHNAFLSTTFNERPFHEQVAGDFVIYRPAP
jgi:hypothetical protein